MGEVDAIWRKTMFQGIGKIEYGEQSKVVAWVDEELSRYYRSLIPKTKCVQPQMYPAHITVVRSYPIEIVLNWTAWGKYKGKTITFDYNGKILYEYPYYYLEAWSQELNDIRIELGLPEFRILRAKMVNCFHITIANVKDNLKVNE